MLGLPRRPARGNDILPWAQSMHDLLGKLYPRGAGVRTGASGTSTRRTAQSGTAATPLRQDSPCAWQPVQTDAFDFQLRKGLVTGFGTTLAPSNPNEVFTCPANAVDGWYVWLQATLTATTFAALQYGSGPALPPGASGDPETGAPPPHVYCPVLIVFSDATGIEYFDPQETTALKIWLTVEDITCTTKVRAAQFGRLYAPPLA